MVADQAKANAEIVINAVIEVKEIIHAFIHTDTDISPLTVSIVATLLRSVIEMETMVKDAVKSVMSAVSEVESLVKVTSEREKYRESNKTGWTPLARTIWSPNYLRMCTQLSEMVNTIINDDIMQ